MSIIKTFFYTVLFCSLIFSTSLFAQNEVQIVEQKPELVAMVNVYNAKVDSQVDDTLALSFSISNGEGVQTDVRYSVRLMQATTKKGTVLVDEKVYDDTLTLSENSTLQKTVVYEAPSLTPGTYQVFVSLKNTAGFSFGTASFGDIEFKGSTKGAQIVPDSCAFTTVGALGVSCTVQSTVLGTTIVTPVAQTYERSVHGTVVADTALGAVPITLKAKEKKSVFFALRKATAPGMYMVAVQLSSPAASSNTIYLPYTVEGVDTSIIQASANADYYEKGSGADVFVLWGGSQKVIIEAKITSGILTCGSGQMNDLTKGSTTVRVPIARNCIHPTVSISLKGDDGVVLDEKIIEMQTKSEVEHSFPFTTKEVALLATLGVFVVFGTGMFLKKKKAVTTSSSTILPLFIVVCSLSLVPFSRASAYTYVMGSSNNIQLEVTVSGGSSTVPPIFPDAANTQIIVSAQLELLNIISGESYTINSTAVTVGNTAVQLFDDPVILNTTNTFQAGTLKYLTAPRCDTTNPCPRSENIAISTEVITSTIPTTIGNVFVTGPHFHNGILSRKVVYVGQPIHPAFTVRVKNFGQGVPYQNTSTVAPPDIDDGIYYFPEGFSSSGNVQLSTSCSGSGCTVGTAGYNYAVAVSTSNSQISTYIPPGYHVCRYADAPGSGVYFSPAQISNLQDTCQNRYPDAEVIY
jgi:hypothetical protein